MHEAILANKAWVVLLVEDMSVAEDGEEAEHLLGMMADGLKKARRGRNPLLATGSGVMVRVWRQVQAPMGAMKGA